jgi:hypothetical protein
MLTHGSCLEAGAVGHDLRISLCNFLMTKVGIEVVGKASIQFNTINGHHKSSRLVLTPGNEIGTTPAMNATCILIGNMAGHERKSQFYQRLDAFILAFIGE